MTDRPAGFDAGIALRLASVGLFMAMTLCVRLAAAGAPTGQIMFWRSAVALVPILTYVAWRGMLGSVFLTRRLRAHFMRSLFGCASMYFSFVSLAYLPLANATAISFLTPLVSLPLAALLLGDRPGPVLTGSAVLGFVGVILMLAPAIQAPQLETAMLIGVGAGLIMVIINAVVRIQIKDLTDTDTPATIAIYFSIVCTLGGLATLPWGWAALDARMVAYLAGAGIFGGLAQLAMTEAMARARISRLAPFEYTGLIWALLFDLAIFAILPTPWSLAGTVLIVLVALIATFHGRFAGTRRAAPPGPG